MEQPDFTDADISAMQEDEPRYEYNSRTELSVLLPSVERNKQKALFIPLDMLHNDYMDSNSRELWNIKDLRRSFLALHNGSNKKILFYNMLEIAGTLMCSDERVYIG